MNIGYSFPLLEGSLFQAHIWIILHKTYKYNIRYQSLSPTITNHPDQLQWRHYNCANQLLIILSLTWNRTSTREYIKERNHKRIGYSNIISNLVHSYSFPVLSKTRPALLYPRALMPCVILGILKKPYTSETYKLRFQFDYCCYSGFS